MKRILKKLKLFPRKMKNLNNKGFSLVEILIVITLILGISASVVVNLMGRRDRAQINQAKITISRLEDAINTFYLDCGYYPSNVEGLEALVIAPEKCESWGPEPYLHKGKIPKDPWKNDFIYEYDESAGTFTVISLGKGGKRGGEGIAADISSQE
ncbi:MAG: type II secretion system major pseudopilin GspG [Bdellovibrionales bacterium]|nr:type II secretion system major pseudopilin GspG [Bdellovibrionales bacterium]